ncbi:CHAT domain-containing protein [Cristinia sonorae]|uniref:CHAT domain-containing protein n=1 Tax=Cristinia sonorae TaxID=1940300 RepID=A0A8K0UGB6_9AGAR|nr:CHAT domain-containing protein [Cristinia sonorae]
MKTREEALLLAQEASAWLTSGKNRPAQRDHFDKAILLYERARNVVNMEDDRVLYASILRQLAIAHKQRFHHFGAKRDLRDAISVSTVALNLLPNDHPAYVNGLLCAGKCVLTRYYSSGKARELDIATSLAQASLSLCPEGHPEREAALEYWVDTLCAKYQKDEDPDDLDLIIAQQESLLELRPPGHPLCAQSLLYLSDTLICRFKIRSERDDIDYAVHLLKERLAMTQGASSIPFLLDYCAALSTRYRKFRDLVDHDLIISCREEILSYTPHDHPSRFGRLHELARAWHDRLRDTGDVTCFDKLVPLYEELMQTIPPRHQDRKQVATDFANALNSRVGLSTLALACHDRIVSLREEAVNACSPQDPSNPTFLSCLADALKGRSSQPRANSADLDRAITVYKEALGYITLDNDTRLDCTLSLASSLRWRYIRDARSEDLLEARSLFVEARRFEYPDDEYHAVFYTGYASVEILHFRDVENPTVPVWDRLVEAGERALALPLDDRVQRAGVRAMHAQVLQNKFTLTWDTDVLDRALPVYREAVETFPVGHPELRLCMVKMADAFKVLYLMYHKKEHVEEAIKIFEDALELVPEDDPFRVRVQTLCGLSDALCLLYTHRGDEEDIERALALGSQALRCTDANDKDQATAHRVMAKASRARYQRRRSLPDLENALTHHEQSVLLLHERDPTYSNVIGELGMALMLRYEVLGDRADSDRAITLQRQAARACHPSQPAYAEYLGNIVTMLFTRNRQYGDPGDVEEALVHCRTVLALRPDDRVRTLLCLSEMMYGFMARHAQTDDPRDWEQVRRVREMILEFDVAGKKTSYSVKVLKGNALTSLPGCTDLDVPPDASNGDDDGEYTSVDDKEQSLLLNARMHSLRFEATQDPSAFSHAQQTYLQLLENTSESLAASHPNRVVIHKSLSDLFYSRYKHSGRDIPDLDAAIAHAQSALPTSGVDKVRLGRLLAERHWECVTPEDERQLLVAMKLFKDVSRSSTCPLHVRFHAARFWAGVAAEHTFAFAVAFDAGSKAMAMEGYRVAFELLPQLAWLGSDVRASLGAIKNAVGLSAEAARCAVVVGGSLTRREAVEFLEAGRSVVWTQATGLRTPVEEVERVAPALATRLRVLSRTLEGGEFGSDAAGAFSSSSSSFGWPVFVPWKVEPGGDTTVVQTHWHLRQEWFSVVQSIRGLPGFEHFLEKKPYEALARVARGGPVVVLVSHASLSVALVVAEEGAQPECVPLKTSLKKLTALHVSLRRVANSRGGAGEEEEEEEEELRAGRPKQAPKAQSGDTILSALWTDVAEPIIKHLTDLKKPKLEDRKRIWWCTVGAFVFMPIHAATATATNTTDTSSVSDFFVSSYTPTLEALLNARARSPPSSPTTTTTTKVLAAIQPNPGSGWSPLPSTRAELDEVRSSVPAANLLRLSPDGDADAEGEREGKYTTPETILARLPDASVLHLACHGDQVVRDPLRSGFVVRGGERLTVEMLMRSHERCRTEGGGGGGGGGVAVLSACHTAGGDRERPDEAINLASAMLFVGFRSVLATMWPMGDADGPTITRAVYGALFGEDVRGDLGRFCLARTLDGVVREMRATGRVRSERWATFIHVGA